MSDPSFMELVVSVFVAGAIGGVVSRAVHVVGGGR